MLEQTLIQILLLLGVTVFVVLIFQRLRIPPSLAYLFVGVILGANTSGPVVAEQGVRAIAELGIVFLLFTIGLSFSLPQIYALRHTILGLGTAQVLLTTLIVGIVAWLIGLPVAAAFVVGAVFAQSSTTIISKQLSELGESQARHGRLGITLSVFQDITAVPFVVVIPVLGIAAMHEVAGSLGLALIKAALAFGIVLLSGRYLLKPLFRLVTEKHSAELFTLTVLFVSLVSAWTTQSLGLSMAFGAFLAGMVLGDTEFRHQVEGAIRPFRDVLLGLFFVSIGMLIDPSVFPSIWLEVISGALFLLTSKLLIVTLIIRVSGIDLPTAFRSAMLLAVGGEFGFALLAIGLEAQAIDSHSAQIVLGSVLLSMIIAPFLIYFNHPISAWLFQRLFPPHSTVVENESLLPVIEHSHVIICGYGRTGQVIGRFLEMEKIPFTAIDMDPSLVKEARLAGHSVYFGDTSNSNLLESVGTKSATLMIISHDDRSAAVKTIQHVRLLNPSLPILARTRDEVNAEALRQAGATEVIPETLETAMVLVSHSFLTLKVPMFKIIQHLNKQRSQSYPLLKELFKGSLDSVHTSDNAVDERLHAIKLTEEHDTVGCTLSSLKLNESNLMVTALVRHNERVRYPSGETVLQAGDVLVLLGLPDDLQQAESVLKHPCNSDDN
ncbi:cation:proton antiporter [Nitrincola sp.]|uniref:cation:proton antiporter domain-containing protein n=1 Tax=Nitrincola sp. TaxID=1926584 RepID=UPI003A8DA708